MDYQLVDLLDTGETPTTKAELHRVLTILQRNFTECLFTYGLLKRESVSFKGYLNPTLDNKFFVNNNGAGWGNVHLLPLDEEGRTIRHVIKKHSTYGDYHYTYTIIYSNNQYLEIHYRS